ncbi:MAG: hypothetical protein ACQPRI_04740 [Solitalea-like symbiont of Tyrophagus putrescentiae]
MAITLPLSKSTSNLSARLIKSGITLIIFILLIYSGPIQSQETSPGKYEGLALHLDVPGGDKGILLPKVELTDTTQYSPIHGQERNGLLVENIRVDTIKGLVHGLYMWNQSRWDKLLTYADIPDISGGTEVYTGTEDPNKSDSSKIITASIGSLYINKTTKTIFKKTDKGWTIEVDLQGTNYIGSTTISVQDDISGKKLSAIAGSGLKLTEQGISASIDNETLKITSAGISAKSGESLWNANKLQDSELGIATPAEGQLLQYKNGKWTNSAERIYKKGIGIDITNDTVSAKSGESLWNANKLQDSELGIATPAEGQLLQYKNGKWTNSAERTYKKGIGIDITNDTVSAKSGESLWNANKLQGKSLQTQTPIQNQVLRYNGTTWGPTNVKELPDGASEGQLLVWTGSAWQPQVSQKIVLGGTDIKFTGLATVGTPQGTDTDYIAIVNKTGQLKKWRGATTGVTQDTTDSILMVNKTGELKKWNGTAWDAKGNTNISGGDQTLGITDTTSTANIVFKTKNVEHMRIDNDGKMRISTKQVFLDGPWEITAVAEQGSDDYVLVADKNKQLRTSKGRLVKEGGPGHVNTNLWYASPPYIPPGTLILDYDSMPKITGSNGEITFNLVYNNIVGGTRELLSYNTIKIGYDNTQGNDKLPIITYAYKRSGNVQEDIYRNREETKETVVYYSTDDAWLSIYVTIEKHNSVYIPNLKIIRNGSKPLLDDSRMEVRGSVRVDY